MEASNGVIEKGSLMDRDTAVAVWQEVEALDGLERSSLRADRVSYTEANEWGVEQDSRYFEITLGGDLPPALLDRVRAAAMSHGRHLGYKGATLVIR